jgi:hypothetical protein
VVAIPSKPRNFSGNDVVADFEIEEDDMCIEDDIIMPPPSIHGHRFQEQIEVIKKLQEYFFCFIKRDVSLKR